MAYTQSKAVIEKIFADFFAQSPKELVEDTNNLTVLIQASITYAGGFFAVENLNSFLNVASIIDKLHWTGKQTQVVERVVEKPVPAPPTEAELRKEHREHFEKAHALGLAGGESNNRTELDRGSETPNARSLRLSEINAKQQISDAAAHERAVRSRIIEGFQHMGMGCVYWPTTQACRVRLQRVQVLVNGKLDEAATTQAVKDLADKMYTKGSVSEMKKFLASLG